MKKTALLISKNPSKRHFQLLEIMVAMFILLACIAPILHIYVVVYKQENVIDRINKQDHLVYLIHAHYTELLYRREISLVDDKDAPPTDVSAYLHKDLQDQLKALSTQGLITLKMLASNKKKEIVKQLWGLDINLGSIGKPLASQSDNKKYSYEIYIERSSS